MRSPSGFPDVVVHASIEPQVNQSGELPAALSNLGAALDPAAWVDAARKRGYPARLAYGLKLGQGLTPQDCQIPEIEIESGWVPIDVRAQRKGQPEGTVRVGRSPARARTAGGEPVAVETTYTLQRAD